MAYFCTLSRLIYFRFSRPPETLTLLLHDEWLPFLFHSGVRLQVNEFWVGAPILWVGCGQLLINDHSLTDIKYPGLTLSDRPEFVASPKLRSISLCHIWWPKLNTLDKQGDGNWFLNSSKVITSWLFSSDYFIYLFVFLQIVLWENEMTRYSPSVSPRKNVQWQSIMHTRNTFLMAVIFDEIFT